MDANKKGGVAYERHRTEKYFTVRIVSSLLSWSAVRVTPVSGYLWSGGRTPTLIAGRWCGITVTCAANMNTVKNRIFESLQNVHIIYALENLIEWRKRMSKSEIDVTRIFYSGIWVSTGLVVRAMPKIRMIFFQRLGRFWTWGSDIRILRARKTSVHIESSF